MAKESVREALRVQPGAVDLAGYDPAARPLAQARKGPGLAGDAKPLRQLQERLYAASTAGSSRSLLLVLQGMDTAGKGGVTAHVVGALNPIGVRYTAFKKPTDEELAHDFLWRIRRCLPAAGQVAVFDRSHYEDVLVARVHQLVPEQQWRARYDLINEFEAELAAAGTTIVKCFLHVSYDAQRRRLQARLKHPDKRWKFNPGDIDERARWSEYQAAYSDALEQCNTETAPWYVVPSDHKKYRNWAVAEVLLEALAELDPQYPRPSLDVPALMARLAPPG